MTAEDASAAGPPRRPPEPNAAVMVVAIGRRVREQVDAALREHRLAYRHLAALGHLAADEGISYSELARRSGVTAQSMQATLAYLHKIGAVQRSDDTSQGRRARLHVTPHGRELITAGREVLAQSERDLLASLGDKQHAGFVHALLTIFGATAPRPADPADG